MGWCCFRISYTAPGSTTAQSWSRSILSQSLMRRDSTSTSGWRREPKVGLPDAVHQILSSFGCEKACSLSMPRSSFRENPGLAFAWNIGLINEAGARQCHLLQGQLGREVWRETNTRCRLQAQQGTAVRLANSPASLCGTAVGKLGPGVGGGFKAFKSTFLNLKEIISIKDSCNGFSPMRQVTETLQPSAAAPTTFVAPPVSVVRHFVASEWAGV